MSDIPNQLFMQVRYNKNKIELDTFSTDNIHIDDIAYLRQQLVVPVMKDALTALKSPWDKHGAVLQWRSVEKLEEVLKYIGAISDE